MLQWVRGLIWRSREPSARCADDEECVSVHAIGQADPAPGPVRRIVMTNSIYPPRPAATGNPRFLHGYGFVDPWPLPEDHPVQFREDV